MILSTEVDPNSWTVSELIRIGLAAALYLFGLILSIRKSFQLNQRRLYWIGCTSLIVVGTLVMFVVPTFSAKDTVSQRLGIGTWVMLLGLFGAVAGSIRDVLSRKQTPTS